MASDSEYQESLERWTWKNQMLSDERTKVLSPIMTQRGDTCSFFATAATLESNLKVQREMNVSLSITHLKKLDEDSRVLLPTEQGKIKRLLLMIQREGVFGKEDYENIIAHGLLQRDAPRTKIASFRLYHVNHPEDIKRALYELREGGPLLAVVRISRNYTQCYDSGMVYRFDPDRIKRRRDGQPVTHALCVVSFVIEGKVPYLECQDSKGKHFSRGGYLLVDITSLKELYSIRA